MSHLKAQAARFDARLTKEQKDFFELAATMSGFKSLSEFVIHSVQQVATQVVERHHAIQMTENDRKLFFETLLDPPSPNDALIKAAEQYKQQTGAA